MNQSTKKKKVVIIGGGFAGIACAKELANNKNFEVVILDKQNHHLFQPLLYQVASATLAGPDIARSLRGMMSKYKNISVFLDHVMDIDYEKRIVSGKLRTYDYDYLLVAAGMKTSWFGKDEWRPHTVGLKNLRDAHRIRERILVGLERAELTDCLEERKRLMTVVIVGGGPTGVELAGAFEDLVQDALEQDFRRINPTDLRTILVQSGDRILKGFPQDQSEYAREFLENHGTEVVFDRVVGVEDGKVTLKNGTEIEAETIIWAAGVQACRISKKLDCSRDRGGRLLVSPDLSIPNHPEVFAAGDIAAIEDGHGDYVPGLAPAATQMGKHVGKVIKEDLSLETPTENIHKRWKQRSPFEYWDKGIMAIIGKNAAVVSSDQMKLKGTLAWFAWLFIHILFLVGFRNKITVLIQWGFAYLNKKPGSRVFSTGERAADIMERPT